MAGIQVVEVTEANPMGPGPYSPTEPIKDPPVIIINTPIKATYFQNVIPLNITVIQPDSWVTRQNMSEASVWVVGPNTLRLVSCVLDGQSFTLWNGTWANNVVCYYLPKDSQFSASMNVSKGQHTLEVSVYAQAEYYPNAYFPFSSKYNITASQSTTFLVQASSDAIWSPAIDSIKTPSVPFPSSANQDTTYPSSPSPAPTSSSTLLSSPVPTSSQMPTPFLTPTPIITPAQVGSNYLPNPTFLTAIAIVIAVVAVALVSLVCFKKRKLR